MNAPIVIAARGLGKRYRLGEINRQSLQEELHYWWCRLRGRDPRNHLGQVRRSVRGAQHEHIEHNAQHFHALRDVSFDIRAGEAIGLIGSNGAGKSTLLKILTRITDPSEGEAAIEGRIGSLLEVGTGFHPELTGRENIFMNGAILGMRKAEIASKFDAIVDFSEIGPFLDTPVKRYSSGMFIRLAFAIAAHLEPEILLIDEVLAVGDAAFQRKCLGKMSDVTHSGRTVIFVSHSMDAIRRLCTRCLLLRKGRLVFDGAVDAAVDMYLAETGNIEDSRPVILPESSIASVDLILQGRPRTEAFIWKMGARFTVDIHIESHSPVSCPIVRLYMRRPDGQLLFSSFSSIGLTRGSESKRQWTLRCGFSASDLAASPVFMDVWVGMADGHFVVKWPRAALGTILSSSDASVSDRLALTAIPVTWTLASHP